MNVLISTTNSFNNIDIEEFHGYISVKFVTGANWFRDFGASFTSILGGVSTGYTEELEELEELAITALKEKCISLNMNGILGVKIDVEPVFSQSYSMFMISACGTAVRLKDLNSNLSLEDKIRLKVSSALSTISIKSISTLTLSDFETISLTELSKALNHLSIDDLPNLFSILTSYAKKYPTFSNRAKKKFLYIKNRLMSIDESQYINLFFPNLNKEKIRVMKYLGITNYSLILKEFETASTRDEIITLVSSLNITPVNIKKSSIGDLRQLISYLNSNYNNNVEVVTSGMLSKTSTWVCKKCKAKVSLELNRCHSCFNDKYGLPSELLYRDKIAFLETILKVLVKEYALIE